MQARLVKAIPASAGTVSVNRAVADVGSQLRPDIVIQDERTKKIVIVDVTIPFENGTATMAEACETKHWKYARLAQALRDREYGVQVYALLIGAFGSWDPRNEPVLQASMIGTGFDR